MKIKLKYQTRYPGDNTTECKNHRRILVNCCSRENAFNKVAYGKRLVIGRLCVIKNKGKITIGDNGYIFSNYLGHHQKVPVVN